MKSVVFLLLSLFFITGAQAQDIIVRITGDTLHVKIDHANESFLYYRGEETKRDELDVISRAEVSSVLYNYEKPAQGLRKLKERINRGYDIAEIWFLFSESYLPINLQGQNDPGNYYRDLQFGVGFRGGFNFFFNNNFGVGLTYSQSRFKNKLDNIQYIGSSQIGTVSDNILVRYAGAGAVFRFNFSRMESNVELKVGVGYAWYLDEAKLIQDYTITGQGMGLHLSGSYNIWLGTGLYIPINLGINGVNVGNLKLETADKNSGIAKDLQFNIDNSKALSVTRLNLSAGLLFSF